MPLLCRQQFWTTVAGHRSSGGALQLQTTDSAVQGLKIVWDASRPSPSSLPSPSLSPFPFPSLSFPFPIPFPSLPLRSRHPSPNCG